MLGSDVVLYAGGRFKSHGTAGAFMEHVTVSLLDMRLHRVQSSKHHQAAGTPGERGNHATERKSGFNVCGENSGVFML